MSEEDRSPLDDASDFESLGRDNGNHYWWQSDLMKFLGYANKASFSKAVSKAMSSFTSLGLSVTENFRHAERTENGETFEDCKLTRVACYFTAMNGDPRKPEVARAQAYFAAMAEVARQALLHSNNVERMLIREEVTGAQTSLNHVAKQAGVENYAFFLNQGYRGMYNLGLADLKARKGVDVKKVLFDFMGKEELAANLFRVTQTEAKIRNESVSGQSRLEATAFRVGREVRDTIRKLGGTLPEELPAVEDIAQVKSGLKEAARKLSKIDTPKALPKPKKK